MICKLLDFCTLSDMQIEYLNRLAGMDEGARGRLEEADKKLLKVFKERLKEDKHVEEEPSTNLVPDELYVGDPPPRSNFVESNPYACKKCQSILVAGKCNNCK